MGAEQSLSVGAADLRGQGCSAEVVHTHRAGHPPNPRPASHHRTTTDAPERVRQGAWVLDLRVQFFRATVRHGVGPEPDRSGGNGEAKWICGSVASGRW
jgi:hypothetical protein